MGGFVLLLADVISDASSAGALTPIVNAFRRSVSEKAQATIPPMIPRIIPPRIIPSPMSIFVVFDLASCVPITRSVGNSPPAKPGSRVFCNIGVLVS